MSGIFTGIQFLIDLLLAPLRLITQIINYVNKISQVLISVVISIKEVINTLPNWLITYALIGLFVIVIYQLLGRETG